MDRFRYNQLLALAAVAALAPGAAILPPSPQNYAPERDRRRMPYRNPRPASFLPKPAAGPDTRDDKYLHSAARRRRAEARARGEVT